MISCTLIDIFDSAMSAAFTDMRDMIRAQTWHEPEDVPRAFEVTLRDLGLDYGNVVLHRRHRGVFGVYTDELVSQWTYISCTVSSLDSTSQWSQH